MERQEICRQEAGAALSSESSVKGIIRKSLAGEVLALFWQSVKDVLLFARD